MTSHIEVRYEPAIAAARERFLRNPALAELASSSKRYWLISPSRGWHFPRGWWKRAVTGSPR
jgi:hypothetical protein